MPQESPTGKTQRDWQEWETSDDVGTAFYHPAHAQSMVTHTHDLHHFPCQVNHVVSRRQSVWSVWGHGMVFC